MMLLSLLLLPATKKRTVMPGGFRIKLCARQSARKENESGVPTRAKETECVHAKRERGGILFSPELATGRTSVRSPGRAIVCDVVESVSPTLFLLF